MADTEDTPPVRPADETNAFSFAGTTTKSKAEFSIKMQGADAGPAPCDVLCLGLPRIQNKHNRSDGYKMSRCPISPQANAKPSGHGQRNIIGGVPGIYHSIVFANALILAHAVHPRDHDLVLSCRGMLWSLAARPN
jgi:hypothetical protein